MNTNITNICRNYKNIIECEFLEDDVFSAKLVSYYKTFIETSDLNNPEIVKKLQCLDSVLYKYVDVENYNFSKRLKDTIDIPTVVSDSFSYINEFMEYVIAFSNEYENTKNNVIVQTRWF